MGVMGDKPELTDFVAIADDDEAIYSSKIGHGMTNESLDLNIEHFQDETADKILELASRTGFPVDVEVLVAIKPSEKGHDKPDYGDRP